MRILSVTARLFGPFANQSLALAPGMTLVWGANEAGKSSWHAALYVAVCGMRRGKGPVRAEDRAFRERHRPWDAVGWEVGAVLELADGRVIQLQHDLDGRVESRAWDDTLGRDVSGEIMHEGAPDASRWIGLDRQAFLSVACVRQGDIGAVRDDGELLQEYLQRAAATAGTAATAAGAISRIESVLSDAVGLDRSNSTRPLRRAIDRAARVRSLLSGAREQHDAYLALVDEAEWLQALAAQAAHRLTRARAAVARRDLAQQESRLARVRELQSRYPAGPPARRDDDGLAQDVAAAVRAWETRPDPAPLTGTPADELRREIEALPLPPIGECVPGPAVLEAHRAVTGLRQALERHQEERPREPEPDAGGTPAAGVLRDLARALDTPVPALDPGLDGQRRQLQARLDTLRARRGVRIGIGIASAVCAVGGGLALVLHVVAPAIGLLVLAIAGAVWWTTQGGRGAEVRLLDDLRAVEAPLGEERHFMSQVLRHHQLAREQAAAMGIRADATALRAMADRVDAAERLRSDSARWTETSRALQERAEKAESELGDALRARGIDTASGLDSSLAAYEAQCLRRSEQAAGASRRAALERELAAREAAERSQREAFERRASAERELEDVARRCGLTDPDGSSRMEMLSAWQAARLDAVRQHDEEARGWNELQHLLDGSTVERLERQASDLAARVEQFSVAADGDLGPATPDTVDVGGDAQLPEADSLRAAKAAAEARGRVEQLAKDLPSVAEAEEEVAAAERELDRVRRLSSTLTLTLEFLRRAQDRVHRDIAPMLAETMRGSLPLVTDGRYVDVRVDPESLAVLVSEPGGRWREAALLSHGTAEQVYLLLRISMARHLTPAGESCPLIFDEVTVQSDLPRTEAMLSALHALSREQQVILFSQEHHVLDWAERQLAEPHDRIVRLDPPVNAGSWNPSAGRDA